MFSLVYVPISRFFLIRLTNGLTDRWAKVIAWSFHVCVCKVNIHNPPSSHLTRMAYLATVHRFLTSNMSICSNMSQINTSPIIYVKQLHLLFTSQYNNGCGYMFILETINWYISLIKLNPDQVTCSCGGPYNHHPGNNLTNKALAGFGKQTLLATQS